MVRGNPLPPHRLLLSINSKKGSFICTIPDRITHTTAFVTPVVEHWLEREIAQWVHPMKDRSDDPLHHERTLLPQSYILLLVVDKEDKAEEKAVVDKEDKAEEKAKREVNQSV